MTSLSLIFTSAGAVLLAIIGAFFSGRLTGAAREREHQKAKEAEAYEDHLTRIAVAANAGDGRLPDIKTDPNNRDASG